MTGEFHLTERPSEAAELNGKAPLLSHDRPPFLTPTAPAVPPMTGSSEVLLLGELELPAVGESVPRARHFSRSVLAGCGAPPIRFDAEVLVSELVTNAIRHPAVTGFRLSLRLLRVGALLRIEVHDPSPALPREVHVDLMEETGRGWFLVAALADRHGTEQTAAGKSVWCEMRVWPQSPAQ